MTNQSETKGSTSKQMKRLWSKEIHAGSLKQFARKLLAAKDELAVEWFAHKHGSLEKQAKISRMNNKGGRISLERQASKSARRRTKSTSPSL